MQVVNAPGQRPEHAPVDDQDGHEPAGGRKLIELAADSAARKGRALVRPAHWHPAMHHEDVEREQEPRRWLNFRLRGCDCDGEEVCGVRGD